MIGLLISDMDEGRLIRLIRLTCWLCPLSCVLRSIEDGRVGEDDHFCHVLSQETWQKMGVFLLHLQFFWELSLVHLYIRVFLPFSSLAAERTFSFQYIDRHEKLQSLLYSLILKTSLTIVFTVQLLGLLKSMIFNGTLKWQIKVIAYEIWGCLIIICLGSF